MLLDALKRTKKERGLRIVNPNNYLSEGHIKKANHNLIVMTDLNSLGHDDWTVITAYYAMYHAALALLAKIGLESKDHATTAAILEYFFGKQINKDIIEKFNELKKEKDKIEAITISEKYIDYFWKIKRAREVAQYGISLGCRETGLIAANAREFVSKIKSVINELDENIIGMINEKMEEFKKIV